MTEIRIVLVYMYDNPKTLSLLNAPMTAVGHMKQAVSVVILDCVKSIHTTTYLL
jgi:hypothetical protein